MTFKPRDDETTTTRCEDETTRNTTRRAQPIAQLTPHTIPFHTAPPPNLFATTHPPLFNAHNTICHQFSKCCIASAPDGDLTVVCISTAHCPLKCSCEVEEERSRGCKYVQGWETY